MVYVATPPLKVPVNVGPLVATTGVFSGAITSDDTLQIDGNTLLGTTTAATGDPRLDVVSPGAAQAAIAISNVITDATNKTTEIAIRHHTNAEQPFALVAGDALSSLNRLLLGGGHSNFNAATEIQIYTAANITTLGGTLAADITGVGTASILRLRGDITIDEDLNHDGSNVGFYGTAPIALQTGVAATEAGIHAALVALGLITA